MHEGYGTSQVVIDERATKAQREAEMASGTFHSRGAIDQQHAGRYGFLTVVTDGPYGIIDEESYPRAS